MAQSPYLSEISSEFQPELTDIQRKQKLAELLMQRGMQQPQGQMVGGRFVAPSMTERLASLFNIYSGRNLQETTEQRQQALAQKLRQAEMGDIQKFMEAGQTKPAETVYGAGEEGPTMTTTPEVKPDYRKQLAIALSSQSPTVRALGTEMLKQSMTPTKLGEGESLVTRDIFGTGGYAPIAQGAEKLPTEYKEYIKAQEGGFQGTFFDYQNALKRAGATNVQVSTEKSYGAEFGQGLAKNDVSLYQAATKAPQVLQTVQDTKKLLDSGKIITGFGANQRLDVARLGSALNIGGKDAKEVVANTQQLFANRAQATLDSIRESNLGAGQGFSNADRDFLEKAKLGGIVYDKETLKRQLDIEERVARASANKWNDRIKNIPESATKPTGVGPVFITQPNAPAAGGVKFLGFE
jgi:hypothetical protein